MPLGPQSYRVAAVLAATPVPAWSLCVRYRQEALEAVYRAEGKVKEIEKLMAPGVLVPTDIMDTLLARAVAQGALAGAIILSSRAPRLPAHVVQRSSARVACPLFFAQHFVLLVTDMVGGKVERSRMGQIFGLACAAERARR